MTERTSPEGQEQNQFAAKFVEDWKAFSHARNQSRAARRKYYSASFLISKRTHNQQAVDRIERLQQTTKEKFAQATQELDKDFASGTELFTNINWQGIQQLTAHYDSPQEFIEDYDSGLFTWTHYKTRRHAQDVGIGNSEVTFLRKTVKEASARTPQTQ